MLTVCFIVSGIIIWASDDQEIKCMVCNLGYQVRLRYCFSEQRLINAGYRYVKTVGPKLLVRDNWSMVCELGASPPDVTPWGKIDENWGGIIIAAECLKCQLWTTVLLPFILYATLHEV